MKYFLLGQHFNKMTIWVWPKARRVDPQTCKKNAERTRKMNPQARTGPACNDP